MDNGLLDLDGISDDLGAVQYKGETYAIKTPSAAGFADLIQVSRQFQQVDVSDVEKTQDIWGKIMDGCVAIFDQVIPDLPENELRAMSQPKFMALVQHVMGKVYGHDPTDELEPEQAEADPEGEAPAPETNEPTSGSKPAPASATSSSAVSG